jgi:hypothetical protein
MSRDPYITAIERELKHWPDVSYTWDRSRKHRKVHLEFDGKKKWTTVPSTSSDNVRGFKNNVTNLKKTLTDMGARRLAAIPTSKREQQEEAVNMAEGAPIRVGISDHAVVVIPKTSEFYDRFADAKNRPKGHWALEMRSNPDLKGEPILAIVPKKMPPGKKRMNGMVGGSFSKATAGFQLTFAIGSIEKIAEKFGKFRTTAAVVSQNNGELHLKLPSDRLEPILRGERRLEALTAPPEPEPEPEIVEEPTPTPVAEAPTMGIEALAKLLAGMPKQSDKMTLQFPERPLTVERCVDFINRRVQAKGKSNLRILLDQETGLISYIEKGGPAY